MATNMGTNRNALRLIFIFLSRTVNHLPVRLLYLLFNVDLAKLLIGKLLFDPLCHGIDLLGRGII